MKILVLNGPNMRMLGKREPDIYGSTTYAQLVDRLEELGDELGVEVNCVQSNHEGELVDVICDARGDYDGIVINPAAFSHTSLAIHDALKAAAVPAVEVHVSHMVSREDIRRRLVTAPACVGMIAGLGVSGYEYALRALVERSCGTV
ncbi:MAG: type II 3-dehydroquinate dehydratase [Lentisphaeria bacterium]|nr:type II 3-dehydroquinate dehydratase [Lentisphaeria bacterium]